MNIRIEPGKYRAKNKITVYLMLDGVENPWLEYEPGEEFEIEKTAPRWWYGVEDLSEDFDDCEEPEYEKIS